MKERILAILREADGFVSGQKICETCGVSRTAVWKAIQSLIETGYEIEAVRNKGYRLLDEPDRITKEAIADGPDTDWAGCRIEILQEVDSTNHYARKLAEDGAQHGTLVVSEVQTAGKGRMGRPWSSPAGTGIWMSLLMRPQIAPQHASMITLVMGLAVCRAVRRTAGVQAMLKWPNDIILDNKKVCGILTEMSADPDRINHIVVGVGINVLDEAFPEEIQDVAVSIYGASGKRVSRTDLIRCVLQEFEALYAVFEKREDLTELADAYNSVLINNGRTVKVLDPKGVYEGISRGINTQGELLVETQDGLREVYAGEVSVRGVLGYV